jgi:hypothetical protein
VTAVVKHVTRKPLEVSNATVEQAQARNSHLRGRFPARAAELWWPHTAQPLEETLRRLTAPPFDSAANGTRARRRRGVTKLLRWLSSLPGDTWQQRWTASGAEDSPVLPGWIFRCGGCASAGTRRRMTEMTCPRGCSC